MWRFSKDFPNIPWQEAVLKKAVLWRGSNAVKMRQRLEASSFSIKVLVENCGNFIFCSEVNRQRRKTRWRLSVRCWVSSRPKRVCGVAETEKGQMGLDRLQWRCCAARPAWDVRATSPTDDHHSHTQAMARAEGQTYPGEVVWLNKQQKENNKKENNFGRTVLKLCWVITGWLPPFPSFVTDTDSRYTLW